MVDPTDAHLGRRWVRRGKLLLFLLWEVILSKSVASAFSQSSTHSRFRAVPTHHHTQQQRHPLLRRINMYPKTGKNAHFRKRYGQEEQLRMARNDNELGWIERILSSSFESKRSTDFTRPVTTTQQANTIPVSLHSAPASRRVLFGSTLIGVGTALSYGTTDVACAAGSDTTTSNNMVGKDAGTTANRSKSRLQWQVTPVNKRTGVTVYDAERAGYKVNFVTYLSRFLLTFDPDCQRWWINRAADIPRTATADQVTAYRNSQFGAFSASVEVGLQEYGRPNGPETLFASLIRRYCPNDSTGTTGTAATPAASASAALSMGAGMDGTTASKLRRDREMKEARRQICLLFGLMEQNQPVDALTQQLAAIDNGSIARIQIIDRGSGYAPGYGSPDVRFPPPEAGSGYVTATGRAILSPNGKLLRIDVINRGAGYSKPPLVTISPPAAIRFSDVGTEFAEAAQAEATLFRSGPNKGRVERIQLISPGAGYTQREIIRILIRPSDTPIQKGGITATATAVLEYEVSEIVIVNNGTGYAVEKPIKIYVEPPPPTALSNMNDPLIVRSIAATESSSSSKELRNKVSDSKDPLSIPSLRVIPDNLGSSRPVVAVAYPTAVNKNIFNAFRKSDDDPLKTGMADVSEKATSPSPRRIVSATSAGDLPEPLNFVSGGSSELLSLLPAGVGLEFNALYNRYELAVDPNYQDNAPLWLKSKARKIDPDFGPRGRSPIERDMQLGVATYLRFILSGAICCSGAHLLLTPIDVVKTKIQTDPVKYYGIIPSFKTVLKEEGAAGFVQGWAPTFLGFFLWGGVSYALTEFIRRFLTESLGTEAIGFEVPIILCASAAGAFVGSFIICPFESVRIRAVSQKDYAPDIFSVFLRMYREEGVPSLFAAVPLFLVKEIPFAMAKFTVFDLSTAWMYTQFPAAREDLQLSLLVSLLGGTFGGVSAAVVSNPADVTISTLKKSKSNVGAFATAALILENGGPSALFRGLPLRFVFFALLVSLQFLVYDSIRFALGIGTDDLKLYLDVLGGALSETVATSNF